MAASEKKWFIAFSDHYEGPYTPREIRIRIEEGTVEENPYIWCEGMPNWLRLTDTGLKLFPTPPPLPAKSAAPRAGWTMAPTESTPEPEPAPAVPVRDGITDPYGIQYDHGRERSFGEPSFVEQSFADPGYVEPGYAVPGHSGQAYADHGYAEPSFGEPGYAVELAHVEPAQAEPAPGLEPAPVLEPAPPVDPTVTQQATSTDAVQGGDPRALARAKRMKVWWTLVVVFGLACLAVGALRYLEP